MKKKLLFVVNVDWFFQSHRLPIALAAMREGYEVHLATTFTDRRGALAAHGLKLHELKMERSGAGLLDELRVLLRLRRLFRQVRPDIVHLVTVKPVVLGGIAARLAGVPAVVAAVSGLGFVFIARGWSAWGLRQAVIALYRIALGHSNLRVVFQNEADRDLLCRAAKLHPRQTAIIRGSGVDLAHFAVRPLPPEPPVVALFAARLLLDKGLREFVDAARRLKAEGLPVVFRLAGAPDPHNRASVDDRTVSAWTAEGIVEALGHREDMADVLAGAHIVVLPSYREGLPKVLAEAGACGRPVVTTDVPGCRDAIVPGESGLLVPVRDAGALAQAMRELALDRPRRERMGQAGRRFAEQVFSLESIVGQHVALYRALEAGRP